jgi:hypothetical protein
MASVQYNTAPPPPNPCLPVAKPGSQLRQNVGTFGTLVGGGIAVVGGGGGARVVDGPRAHGARAPHALEEARQVAAGQDVAHV